MKFNLATWREWPEQRATKALVVPEEASHEISPEFGAVILNARMLGPEAVEFYFDDRFGERTELPIGELLAGNTWEES